MEEYENLLLVLRAAYIVLSFFLCVDSHHQLSVLFHGETVSHELRQISHEMHTNFARISHEFRTYFAGMYRPLMTFGISWIELSERGLGNSLQHLLREDTKQLPSDVQGLLDRSILVVTLREGGG